MLVTLSGIVMLVSPLQSEKAWLPMFVTAVKGKATDARHAVRDRDACEGVAEAERTLADACCSIGNDDVPAFTNILFDIESIPLEVIPRTCAGYNRKTAMRA